MHWIAYKQAMCRSARVKKVGLPTCSGTSTRRVIFEPQQFCVGEGRLVLPSDTHHRSSAQTVQHLLLALRFERRKPA